MNQFKIITFILLLAALFALQGCAPRGETKSLDQILSSAKERFARSSPESVQGKAAAPLKSLTEKLNVIEGGTVGGFTKNSAEVSTLLYQLAESAGYTSRPSLGELALQYGAFSPSQAAAPDRAQVKLLVARTYSLLASELETARFMY